MQVFQVQLNSIFLSFQNPFSSSSLHFHRFSRLYVYENPLLFYRLLIVFLLLFVCLFVCFDFYFIFVIYFKFFFLSFLFLYQFFKFVQLFSAPATLVNHIVKSACSSYGFGNEASIQADPTANPGL